MRQWLYYERYLVPDARISKHRFLAVVYNNFAVSSNPLSTHIYSSLPVNSLFYIRYFSAHMKPQKKKKRKEEKYLNAGPMILTNNKTKQNTPPAVNLHSNARPSPAISPVSLVKRPHGRSLLSVTTPSWLNRRTLLAILFYNWCCRRALLHGIYLGWRA